MDESTRTGGRRLRAVGGAPVDDAATLTEAVAECVGAAPGGIAPRALGSAVAGHLGVEAGRVDAGALSVAVGVLIASGRIDEQGGRLMPVAQERRRAV